MKRCAICDHRPELDMTTCPLCGEASWEDLAGADEGEAIAEDVKAPLVDGGETATTQQRRNKQRGWR